MGRPTKLTAALQKQICKLVEDDNYFEVAAQAVGITPQTLCNWKAQGQEDTSGPFFELFEAIKKAEARAEASRIKTIKIASKKSWQAAAWLLERQHPDRWSSFKVTKEQIDKEREAWLVYLRENISPSSYAEVVIAAAKLARGETGSPRREPHGESAG